MKNNYTSNKHSGFTLVEIAIVLIIFGFLLTAILLPLQAQRDISKQLETQVFLENAKKSIIGFSQTKGYLPCPATENGTGTFPDDTGNENPDGGGSCTLQSGFLPGKTLGLNPVDNNGYAIDAWGNKIRYAVTFSSLTTSNPFTTPYAMNNAGLTNLDPSLRVCSTASTSSCTANISLINNAVAVIYSTGPTGALASGGADETENGDGDTIFVSHTASAATASNGEFDHIVTWISPYILYNAMIEAGQLH